MGVFDKIFKKSNITLNGVNDNLSFSVEQKMEDANLLSDVSLPIDEIVDVSKDGFLDTTSVLSIKKFKHNLEVLVKKAKRDKKINKFMIIRDDNFFPYDWKWRILSSNTYIEKIALALSIELKTQYALEKANISPSTSGIPTFISEERIRQSLSNVEREAGFVSVPVHFRSTKHFTINTPLEATGNYNFVDTDRKFTIIDDIKLFLSSGYAYSVSYHDAYLDVSHESLPISDDAIVLIEKSKYESIIDDPIIKKQLSERRVVVYIGDRYLAINMILSELGVLPSTVGLRYITYDEEVLNILDSSIRALASDNNLLYDKSHGCTLGRFSGHFTSYYDDKNCDFDLSLDEFVEFLRYKFPDYSSLITRKNINDKIYSKRIVQAIGTTKLLDAISEYNAKKEEELSIKFDRYTRDRDNITLDISTIFKSTLYHINSYYNNEEYNSYSLDVQNKVDDLVCHFFQDDTVCEQLVAAKNLLNLFQQLQNIDSFIYQSVADDSDLEHWNKPLKK